MTASISFALNHIAAPRLGAAAFFALARELGLGEVEIRNDLEGVPILDGTSATAIKAEAAAKGVGILSINALQRFNEWTKARETEARTLAAYARTCGAGALVLVPVNDEAFKPGESARRAGLREALKELRPILDAAGIRGFVEPLGFMISSLRSKREAVEAIDHIGGGEVFHLVHDTFHHHLAGEPQMFPERTGLAHISGVTDPTLAIADMRDAHRVLVDAGDRLGNLAQIRALRRGGYAGPFSFEPFAESVQKAPDIAAQLSASMRFIEAKA
jgi:2-keto-myo-inositol isomerase